MLRPRQSPEERVQTTTTTTITGRLTTDVPTCLRAGVSSPPPLVALPTPSLISGFLDRLTEARIKLRSKDTAGHLVTMIFATRAISGSSPASDYRRME